MRVASTVPYIYVYCYVSYIYVHTSNYQANGLCTRVCNQGAETKTTGVVYYKAPLNNFKILKSILKGDGACPGGS